jgi:KDO2-lipid IV(A) lauroyltransferase
MNLKELAIHPRAMRTAMYFSRHMPESLGHTLSWWGSGLVSRSKTATYRIVRANLGQVLGPDTTAPTLDSAARHAFYTLFRSSFDLFRTVQQPLEELEAAVEFPEEAKALARAQLESDQGTMVVFPHLGSFDLAGLALASLVPGIQLISLPDPPPGFQMTNELRALTGTKVTPLSSNALRQAIKTLRAGGMVATAGDRPVSEMDEPVPFFGRPARVPSGHVRLALKTGATLIVCYCILSPETNRYTVHAEPPMEMVYTGNREEEVAINMRRVLDVLETAIHRWSDQWQMFVPVWPELMEA